MYINIYETACVFVLLKEASDCFHLSNELGNLEAASMSSIDEDMDDLFNDIFVRIV